MIVNLGNASVLIKNVPWQEEARYGRVKDHRCVLMSSVHTRLQLLADIAGQRLPGRSSAWD